MKRAVFIILLGAAVLAGGVFWFKQRGHDSAPATAAESQPGNAADSGARVSRDSDGRAVIVLSDKLQGEVGIAVTNPIRAQVSAELRGYGRVMDPAPLAALMMEFATADAARAASANEFGRLKTLAGQGNASARALQAAEAAMLHDQLAAQSARERLVLGWGRPLSEHKDLPALTQALVSMDAAIVRIDLAMGEGLKAPEGVRIETLSGESSGAEYLGVATSVDPQIQGRGFLFLCASNRLRLAPGQAVTGYLQVPGGPVQGVIVPREAVVRTEGAGWVYVTDKGVAKQFKRTQIALDHPVESGWFITNAVEAGDSVVVNGAQQLLSTELRGGGGE